MRMMKPVLISTAVLCMLVLRTSPAQAWCTPIILHCGSVVDTNTVSGHDDVSQYNCTGATRFNGKAHVYRIAHPGDSLWLTLEWQGDAARELGLFILTSCNRNACIAYDPHFIATSLAPGNYWIIVDSRTDSGTVYRLRVNCGDVPLPVELLDFNAERCAEGVQLSWSTASETDNSGFRLERQAEESESWQAVTVIPGQGTTVTRTNYLYVDADVRDDLAYAYRLISMDFGGAERELQLVVVERGSVETALPAEFRLVGCYPNPFNPGTRVVFELSESSDITLNVFNVNGQLAQMLASGTYSVGRHEVMFDASSLPSGIYFAQLRSGTESQMLKLVLMK